MMTSHQLSLWELRNNSKPDDSNTNSQFYRQALQQAQAYLESEFKNNADIVELVHLRAHFVDQVLSHLWQQHLPDGSDLALLAVGGYGRGELHPFSDIDLLILLSPSSSSAPPAGLTQFLTQLWDIGLEIGHSVRTIEECRAQAIDDITIATNLLETRLLSGDNELYSELQNITQHNKAWDTHLFYENKKQEQKTRHNKYNNTANNLEPNLKESPGGLRDIQIISWVSQQYFNEGDLKGLNQKGFISDTEYNILDSAQRFLWKVRFGLHLLANRKQEKLMIDYQRELAEMLGYKKTENRLAVEHFMKEYYLCARSVRQMNELLLQLFEENIILANDSTKITAINPRFQINNGYIETINSGIFAYYPYAMLELFLLLQQHPDVKGVRADTIRQLHAHIHLIDDQFRNDIKNRNLFLDIIRNPTGITDQFRKMNTFGVLGAYLPEFGQIVGQMQHDLFHAYTVDQHTLFLVRNLRRFSCSEYKNEFPLCSDVFTQLPKPELLYIAGLFHDIAKGRGGDHSKLGVVDATAFCQRHALSQQDTDIVTFLVRQHLTMSTTAQKFDIQDPDVVKNFADTVGSVNKLNYLYLLTVADIRATNSELWNGWRDSLLKQLYQNTRQWFEESEKLAKTTLEKALKIQKSLHEKLLNIGYSDSQITSLWAHYDPYYFAKYTIDELIWQSTCRLEQINKDTIVTARQYTQHNTLEIFIFTYDRPRIFAATTSCIEKLQLDILDAKISATSNGDTLNTYIVNGAIDNTEEIVEALTNSLDNLDMIFDNSNVITPRTMKLFETRPTIKFKTDDEKDHTVLELHTHDRPGLLSSISQVFLKCDIQLLNAKLTTLGDQVDDIFIITSAEYSHLNEEQQINLKAALVDKLVTEKTN